MRAVRPAIVPARLGIGLAIALAMGIVIGFVDSRPGWDDTGITVVSLLLASGVAACVAGRGLGAAIGWLAARRP